MEMNPAYIAIDDLPATLVKMLRWWGNREPEDAAQTIILKNLNAGRSLLQKSGYWYVAAKNATIDLQRRRAYHHKNTGPLYTDFGEPEGESIILGTPIDSRLEKLRDSTPEKDWNWLLSYYDLMGSRVTTGRERAKAHRIVCKMRKAAGVA